MNDELEQRLFDILATTEQVNNTTKEQQQAIDKQMAVIATTLKRFDGLDKQILDTIGDEIRLQVAQVVAQEVARGLTSDISKIEKEVSFNAKEFNNNLKFETKELTNVIKKTKSDLGYQNLAVWGVGVGAVLAVIITFIAFYVPSLDEVTQRRQRVADAEQVGAIFQRCEGKPCVKIKPKQCNFGGGEYCVVATK